MLPKVRPHPRFGHAIRERQHWRCAKSAWKLGNSASVLPHLSNTASLNYSIRQQQTPTASGTTSDQKTLRATLSRNRATNQSTTVNGTMASEQYREPPNHPPWALSWAVFSWAGSLGASSLNDSCSRSMSVMLLSMTANL